MTASEAMRLMRSSSRVSRLPDVRFQLGSVFPDLRTDARAAVDMLLPRGEGAAGDGGRVWERVGEGVP